MNIEPERQGADRLDLAATLRKLRKAAGLSGERLAVRCAMSQSKISRIETGKTVASVMDVERILKALEVPAEVARELLTLARMANVGYTSMRAYASIGLWRRQEELQALTNSCSIVRYFLPAIPSGMLQLPEYVEQVVSPTVPGGPAVEVERIVQARLARQKILDDASRRFVFVMTEQAVLWRHADDRVMARQLMHMADVAEKPAVEIAVIPQSRAVYAAPLNVFVIYDERLVTVETFSGTITLRDPQEISYHLNLFEFFLGHALRGDAAVAFLHSAAREFM